MEYIEGEAPKGPLPVKEVLRIARQIVDALQEAHWKNITHRDLKPANIKIKPDGLVKVLDFGLAKLHHESDRADDATITMGGTVEGAILGTAAYMCPEQARGQKADKRSDIWAFGVVLYELLTGQRPFQGSTMTDVLAAVLKHDPDWTPIPPEARRLLQRCLEKEPRHRLQDIGDAWDLLQPVQVQARPSRNFSPALWGAIGVLSVVAFWGWWRAAQSPSPSARPMVRLDADLGDLETSNMIGGSLVVLSPDGTRIAGTGKGGLFVRRLDQVSNTQIPATEGAAAPFFSPDGNWVAFTSDGKIKKAPIDGGAPVVLADGFPGRLAGAWGRNGMLVVPTAYASGLTAIPESGGEQKPLTTVDRTRGEAGHRWPQFLPGDKALLFTAYKSVILGASGNIEVVKLPLGERKHLMAGGWAHYLPSGHLIYLDGQRLNAIRFDPEKLEVQGEPVVLLSDVAVSSVTGAPQVTISGEGSGSGTLIYSRSDQPRVTIQSFDASGTLHPIVSKPGDYLAVSISHDGKRFAFGSDGDIWIYDASRDTTERRTFGGGPFVYPVWTPDDRYILFQRTDGISWTRSDGGGTPQIFTKTTNQQFPWSFSSDGKRLAYLEVDPGGTGYDLWTIPVEAANSGLQAGKPEVFLKTPVDERHPSISPDGQCLAYSSAESGSFQIYVRRFPDTGGKWQVSSAGGVYPMWSRTANELFFRTEDNQIMVARYRIQGDSFVPDKVRLWSEKRLANVGTVRNFDLAPDGKHIIALIPAETPANQRAQNQATFLLNFFDELRRRLPPR